MKIEPIKSQKSKTALRLFLIFFKASAFTFAGGLAMLPVIEKDIVEKYEMQSREDFLESATLSQTLPGVIAVNCACLTGRSAAGFLGMLAAGLGAMLPAFVLMLAATILITIIPREGAVVGIFRGVRAASSALVLSAAFTLGRGNIKNAFGVVLMFSAFALMTMAGMSAFFVVILAAAVGFLWQVWQDRRKGGKKA